MNGFFLCVAIFGHFDDIKQMNYLGIHSHLNQLKPNKWEGGRYKIECHRVDTIQLFKMKKKEFARE